MSLIMEKNISLFNMEIFLFFRILIENYLELIFKPLIKNFLKKS
jgi:hypothetical protein